MWNERERDRRARERGMCGHLCASEWEAHKYVRGCNIAGGWFACGDEEDRASACGGGICVRLCPGCYNRVRPGCDSSAHVCARLRHVEEGAREATGRRARVPVAVECGNECARLWRETHVGGRLCDVKCLCEAIERRA